MPPFHGRLKKKGNEHQFCKFLDMLKRLHINIPFVDTLEQMPSHVKFFKDILAKKRRMNEYGIVALMQATSDFFKNRISEKITNPGTFTVGCSIDGMDSCCALRNLGASINFMPLSVSRNWE